MVSKVRKREDLMEVASSLMAAFIFKILEK